SQRWSERLKSGRGDILLRVIGLAASVLVLWYLGAWSEFSAIIQDIAPLILILALALAMISTWITSVRWRLLDPDLGKQMRGWDYFRYVMIGATANMFMPGALGGDAIRIALVAKDLDSHRGDAVAAIVADRWIGLFSIILLGTIACLGATGLEHRAELLSVLLAMDLAFLFGWIVATNTSLSNWLLGVVDRPGTLWRLLGSVFSAWQRSIEFYAAHPARVLGALTLCLPIHACWFLIVYLLALETGIDMSFLSLAMITALSWVIVAAPVSFGGVGVRELSFVYLLSLQGIDAERALVLGALQSAIFLVRAIIGVPLFWLGRKSLGMQSGAGDG
ncbi:MAG: flippase-like domain-containing protein, partial [Gammaproteobacteria bacterium]|nr:flippase-like domain-containing protein [Gammaproteobacteria bacterium]